MKFNIVRALKIGAFIGLAANATAGDAAKNNFYLMRMGSGVDSVTQTATSTQSCLANAAKPGSIYIGNPKAVINFSQQQKLHAVENALNVHVSGKYGGDRFGMSVDVKFANDAKDTLYSTNLLYLFEYSGK